MSMQYAPETAAEESSSSASDGSELIVGTATGSQPFAPAPTEPASEGGDAGVPEAPPAPEYVPKAEFEALKKQAEELAAWRTEQQQREQAAAVEQAKQQQTQIVSAIEERVRSYNTTGVPDDDLPILQQALTRFAQQNTPEFQASMRQAAEYVQGLEREGAARQIIKDHLIPTLYSNMTPAQVLKQVSDWETELLSFGQGKEVMESLAKRWARDMIVTNGNARRASGAEATERGGAGFGGGGNPVARYKEALRTGKPLPSPAEIDAMVARQGFLR